MSAYDYAFPHVPPFGQPEFGLTKREYAAVHILAALATRADVIAELDENRSGLAYTAWELADALFGERN